MSGKLKVIMLGASGATGGQVLQTLLADPRVEHVTSLGRRTLDLKVSLSGPVFQQEVINVLDPASYKGFLPGYDIALCALGVGQPSKIGKEAFLRIDRDAPLDFGRACKAAGIERFSLLSAVGVTSKSASMYMRSKGQLEDGLRELGFQRLSLVHPSMILTPTNRYGLSQAITLKVWPYVDLLLHGPLRPLRGVKVEDLGRAMALDALKLGTGEQVLTWDDFQQYK